MSDIDMMPEPPPIDYDDWLPPPPDEAYFMPDDPFPNDLFSSEPQDYGYVPVDDPWLPDDDRFMPEDVGHLPDVPPLSQDGLQGFEPPEPADEGWGWHDARLIGVERETDDGTRYEIGAMDVYANVNTGDLGGSYLPVASFEDVDVAAAFYHTLQEQMHDQALPAYQVPEFAEARAAEMNPEPEQWRGATPEEYAAYEHLRDLDDGGIVDTFQQVLARRLRRGRRGRGRRRLRRFRCGRTGGQGGGGGEGGGEGTAHRASVAQRRRRRQPRGARGAAVRPCQRSATFTSRPNWSRTRMTV